MRHVPRSLAVALLLALLPAACGGDGGGAGEPAVGAQEPRPETAPAAEPVIVELVPQNRSGQSGTATLTPGEGGKGFAVALEVTPPKRFAGPNQHAHIHDVTCEEYAAISGFEEQLATVVDALNDLRDGTSETQFLTPLADRMTGAFSINVHEQNHPYVAVACGDIPAIP